MSGKRLSALAGCAALVASSWAMAQSEANKPDPAKFQEHKERRLAQAKGMEETMRALSACLQAASDHAGLRDCEKSAREAAMRQQKETKAPSPGNRPD